MIATPEPITVAAPASAPAPASEMPDTERSREVRMGLVMYGGVSLAIYINGVAHEFFRAVRGRGVYRLLKALTDSEFIVDVISGTSAGGINGIMLSYALCNERDFSSTSTLWRQHGGIQHLLRTPTDGNAVSVLDSENYYEPRLREAFAGMPPIRMESSPYEEPSPFGELDLFVTGTDIDGERYTRFDDAGHPISVKDHRAVFLVKHRKGRKEPFRPTHEAAGPLDTTHQALARLSRITSCFPGAFAPVHVTGGDEAGVQLQTWGQLRPSAWFLDGGVLDNKPFTLTLDAIFSRAAERDVDRKLFYVEPDPESFNADERLVSPNVVQAVLTSLIGIPGYESISEDLKRLTDHNSRVERYSRITEHVAGSLDSSNTSTASHVLYVRTRLAVISERVIEGLFKTSGRKRVLTPEERTRAATLIKAFDANVSAPEALFERVDVYYPTRRIYRLIYLIFGMLYRRSPDAADLPPEVVHRYRQLWRMLNRQIKFYEVVRSAMERTLDEINVDWKTQTPEQIWVTVEAALGHLLATDDAHPFQLDLATRLPGERGAMTPAEWLTSSTLSAFNQALKKRMEVLTTRLPEFALQTPNLLQQAASWERDFFDLYAPDPEDPARHAYDGFEALDEVLYPLETMSDVGEKDVIETVRISPHDANRGFSANSLANKVAGDTVYHFGGFFKRSWRANDILWGRLDGLCQLVETLASGERVEQIASRPAWRKRVYSALFDDSGVLRPAYEMATLFPQAGTASQARFEKWLRDLLSDDDERRAAALDERQRTAMITLLIEMGQLEVLSEEIPNVVGDALDEQNDWNRYQVQEGDKLEVEAGVQPWVYRAPSKRLDPFVSVVAAAHRSRHAFGTLVGDGHEASEPRQTPLGRFFIDRYRVGSEELTRDVPSIVLMDILASSLMVVKNCVLATFGDDAVRIRKHPLYRYVLALPLRVFYGLAKLSRRVPGLMLGIGTALVVLCLMLLASAFFWRDTLLCGGDVLYFNPLPSCRGGVFDVSAVLVFLGAPVFILFTLVFVLGWAGRWFGGRPHTPRIRREKG